MKTLTRVGCIASMFMGLGLLTAQPGWAGPTYQLSPASLILEPSGNRSTGAFQVTSTGDEPVALEIRITDRQMDADGNESRADAEDDFVVYPPQILLQPGAVQTVRVTWLGEPNPDQELAFRLITEQLYIDLNLPVLEVTTPVVNITALYNYVASLYVTPRGAASDVVLDSARHQSINGADALVLQFNNQGTAHQLLTGLHLNLTPLGAGGQPQAAAVFLTPEQLQGISGENILAQGQRQFTLPWPAGLPVGPVSATFELR
ncbi:molecular chaperone [Leptolyngbya sp. PCC 6406]|uniref:fimbrial biogenesis chaperone n=1 Tax=Leptolyngbya sp. PCC 6406 TaxID=1173264 RepID=UPI0002ACFCF7|nr:fimbria/pilus periplasmic chaperone [Leptolyngbya sp. PCC 6406]